MFNALKYTRSLEENGFDRRQAEVLVGMYMQMLELNMVSKSDFEKFQNEMYNRFDKIDERFESLESRMNNKLENVDNRFENVEDRFETLEKNIDLKLSKLSLQLTVKLGVMLAISVGMLSTLIALKL